MFARPTPSPAIAERSAGPVPRCLTVPRPCELHMPSRGDSTAARRCYRVRGRAVPSQRRKVSVMPTTLDQVGPVHPLRGRITSTLSPGEAEA
jgi:hypothetical protein